jgi:ATP-dependent Clp protease protease subunit
MSGRYVLPRFLEYNPKGYKEYDPYARLFEDRIIFLGTIVDDISANDIVAQLLCLETINSDLEISIYINSPGGSITSLMAIYDTMNYVKCAIRTVCIGQAASAAAIILSAGTHGMRYALPNARVLLHQPSSSVEYAQVSDLEIQAGESIRVRKLLERILAYHTNRSIRKITSDIERDKILVGKEVVEYGIVDEIISDRKDV